jgi:hypothetical protein
MTLVLILVSSASAKNINRAVLVGADGEWVRVVGSQSTFSDLARDPQAKPQRAHGGFVRMYFVGPGDFPANRARYYPGQRCIALDWPTYGRSCRAVNAKLLPQFARSHAWSRFRTAPTSLVRLRYVTPTVSTSALAGLTGSVEMALLRPGVASSKPSTCYDLRASWSGSAATVRPTRVALCRGSVFASGSRYVLDRGVWQWFRLNFGPPHA